MGRKEQVYRKDSKSLQALEVDLQNLWNTTTIMGYRQKNITNIRNENFHEAMFHGQPLGFTTINNYQYGDDILQQMQALICRLLVAILGVNAPDYITSNVNSREYHSLTLKI